MTATLWAKLIAIIAAIALVFGAGWYLSGLRGEEALAKAQAKYADSISAQNKAAADAIARVQSEEAATRTQNEVITNGLQKQLNDSTASGLDLAGRLRGALAAASGYSASAQAANRQSATLAARVASSESRADAITRAVASYDSACQRDAARFTALIAEIKPQL